MKKQFIICFSIFLLCCSATLSQKAKLWPLSESAAGELLATDPVNNKHYYKSMSFSLKAGQGIVFYMQSSVFTPSIFLTGTNGLQAGTYNNPEKGKGQEATVAVNAFRSVYPNYFPVDTTINLYFSSLEENATGKFNYGYIMLDSSQMLYDEKGPLCNRLIYLINHWQAGWFVIPTLRTSFEPRAGGKRGATTASLMPIKSGEAIGGGWGGFSGHKLYQPCSYEETLFTSSTDNGSVFYQKLIAEVKQCLGDKDWTFKTEVKEDKILKEKYTVNLFQIKGSAKDQARTQFSLVRVVPEKPGKYDPYEVILFFD